MKKVNVDLSIHRREGEVVIREVFGWDGRRVDDREDGDVALVDER